MTQEPSNPTRQSKASDGVEELRKLIGNNDELKTIYAEARVLGLCGSRVAADIESTKVSRRNRNR